MADFIYTARQNDAIDYLDDQVTTEVLFGGAAGGGKTAFGCAWLISQALTYRSTRWLMGRSELKTLKETTLNTFFQIAAMVGMLANVHYRLNQQSGVILFPSTESEILLKDLKLYPSDPNFDSLGSLEITGGFIDEANQITEKAKNIVKSRIRYKLDENGLRPKLLMTCNPAKNWTYQQFYKPSKDNQLPADRAFVQSFVTDNPYISQHYIANLQTLDKASKERLLHGNWNYDDDPSALIEYDNILDMWHNQHVDAGTFYLSIDVARFGSDKSKLCVRSGWRIVRWVVLDKSSVTATASKATELMKQYQIPRSNVIADEDGVGGGVVDILGCKGFLNGSSPLEERNPVTHQLAKPNYANLKSQCYFRLADRINQGGIHFDCQLPTEEREALVEELEQVKQKDMDKDGKKAVLPKETVKELIGRSPDGSDTLMMHEYFELKSKPVAWEVG